MYDTASTARQSSHGPRTLLLQSQNSLSLVSLAGASASRCCYRQINIIVEVSRRPATFEATEVTLCQPVRLLSMFCLSKRHRTTRAQESGLQNLPSGQTEEISTEDDAPLCSICSALDLYDIFRYEVPKRHAVPLGHLTDIFQKYDRCGLCRLVTTSIRRMWRLDQLPSIDLTAITCALYTVDHRLFINTSDRPRDVTLAMTAAQLPFVLEIRLLEEDASKIGKTTEVYSRRVNQNVDIGLLKKWIHTCENEHSEKCENAWWRGSGDVLPKTTRVLDVTRMAIVPAPSKCRYVALSYVWGGTGEGYWTTSANHKKRSMSGGLDVSVLPATISDVVQLVRQLGERYLWIDALCIIQDDPKDKMMQIREMDVIYGSSVFTVFAAGGLSVRDPLPGIRPSTRDPQQCVVKTQGLHLTVPLTFLSEAIASSVWNQRGWTYQELMLSRRRIFFTEHQVHFECMVDLWCEDIITDPVGYTATERHLLQSGTGAGTFSTFRPSSWRNQAYLHDYTEIVRKYTQRKLTVESDIVDAITALLKALFKAYKLACGDYDKAFQFGMPIMDLAEALLWQPTAYAPHSRRPVDDTGTLWPSWSWVGWRGSAGYSSVSMLLNVRADPEKGIFIYESLVQQWYIVDGNGRPVRQDTRLYGHSGEDMQDSSLSLYIAPNGDINPQYLITNNAPLQPGTLVFHTSSARFDVIRANDVVDANDDTSYAIYSILTDIPRLSTLIGRVILPCSVSSPTTCEFIVLARTSHCRGLYDEDVLRKPYLGCMMYVMAVRKIQDERTMERVGLGVIFEQAWLKSTSEHKIVYLR